MKFKIFDEKNEVNLEILREILRKNPTCKFFAVGDDWQSIYRFTGSDNSLLRDFEKIFEKHTYRSYISTTHRFGEPTVSKSCEFILKNSSQFRKNVISTKKDKTNIKIIMNRPGTNNDGESVMKIISLLVERYSYAGT